MNMFFIYNQNDCFVRVIFEILITLIGNHLSFSLIYRQPAELLSTQVPQLPLTYVTSKYYRLDRSSCQTKHMVKVRVQVKFLLLAGCLHTILVSTSSKDNGNGLNSQHHKIKVDR